MPEIKGNRRLTFLQKPNTPLGLLRFVFDWMFYLLIQPVFVFYLNGINKLISLSFRLHKLCLIKARTLKCPYH